MSNRPHTDSQPYGSGIPFNVNFDQYKYVLPGTSGSPTLITTCGDTYSARDISYYSSDQSTKLSWMFNLYQHYRLKSVKMEYYPRYSDNSGLVGQVIGYSLTNPVQYGMSILGPHAEVWFVPDKEDTVTRASLEEFYQIRQCPNARGGEIHKNVSLTVTPMMQDMIVESQSPNIDNANQPHIGIPLNQSSSTGYPLVSSSESMPMPYMPTKGIQSVSGTMAYNNTTSLFGHKCYIYTPFMFGSDAYSNSQVIFGMIHYSYEFEFKDLDYRAILVAIPFVGEDEETMRKIKKIKGERYLLEPKQTAVFTDRNKGLKRHAESQGAIVPETNYDVNKDLDECIAEVKKAGDAPEQTSHHIPESRPSRFPFGPGKRS